MNKQRRQELGDVLDYLDDAIDRLEEIRDDEQDAFDSLSERLQNSKTGDSMLAAIDFNPILAPVLEVLNAILWPAIGLVGSIGTIYCIILGVKLAKSDEAGSREKAKKDLIGAIIGFVCIFVLIVGLKIAMPILQDWVGTQIVA